MTVFGVWGDVSKFNVVDSLLVAAISIVIVFGVLALIIFITWLFQKGIDAVEARTNILPKEENKILATDEDAVVAALVASIDFYKETGKEPEIKSISKIGD